MILFRILIVATLLVIVGYFIQLTAQRAEGYLRPFGKYLSLWVFVLAGLTVVSAAVAPELGYRGFGPRGAAPAIARGAGPGFAARRGFGPRFFERRADRRRRFEQPPQESTPEAAPGAPAPAPTPAP